ncbi:hypothetical protein CVV38_03975 [Candidatus Peregrinibacteria bacterium HGW-Peregrinibacteria-1]|jgi:ABC-type oligopeptide transport system substrate-binding subunit|nr:MAG: hypothetical protein CVV38_03975 [Candidatus Peregrinibacteria bacterium HGW-Peregrinibacteria-1]
MKKNKLIALLIALVAISATIIGCTPQNNEMTAEEQTLVREYINENINDISPTEPVLGGTWYVTDLTFTNPNQVTATYEDGHIMAGFTSEFSIDSDNQVTLSNIQSIEY